MPQQPWRFQPEDIVEIRFDFPYPERVALSWGILQCFSFF